MLALAAEAWGRAVGFPIALLILAAIMRPPKGPRKKRYA